MSRLKIITGSQAALSDEIARKYNIGIIPYYLIYPDKTLKEGVDFQTQDFYQELYDLDNLPTSSPPSVQDILDYLDPIQSDYDEAIIFTISSKYSQMYNTCLQVKKELSDFQLHIYDTQAATGFQAMMTIKAAKMARDNQSVKAIFEMADRFPEISDEFIVMDSLRYLAKGGRIGKVKEILTSLLSIKPIIGHRNGSANPLGKSRTNQQALIAIQNMIKDNLKKHNQSKVDILLYSVLDQEWIAQVEESLKKSLNIQSLDYTQLSAITSIHFGPKSWAVIYSIAD